MKGSGNDGVEARGLRTRRSPGLPSRIYSRDTVHLCALLLEQLDHLADESRLLGVLSRRRRRRELLARVQAVLAVDADDTAPPGLIEATRQAWAADDRVLIADRAPCRVDRAGVWRAASILAATGPGSPDRNEHERLAPRLAARPLLPRSVHVCKA